MLRPTEETLAPCCEISPPFKEEAIWEVEIKEGLSEKRWRGMFMGQRVDPKLSEGTELSCEPATPSTVAHSKAPA